MADKDISTIIAALEQRHPGLHADQIWVKFPGIDDDGIWNFRHPTCNATVSLESSNGMFPFLGESTGHDLRQQVATTPEAVALVETWLGLSEAG